MSINSLNIFLNVDMPDRVKKAFKLKTKTIDG